MRLRRSVIIAFLAFASGSAISGEATVSTEQSLVVNAAAEDLQAAQNRQGISDWAASTREAENCWVQAAKKYGLDAWLLYTIAMQESTLNPRAVNKNTDGSLDVGLMQINSQHFPRLARMGISAESLWEPCLNIHVGAWILADTIRVLGPTWNAVGGYNAGIRNTTTQADKRARYARRIERLYYRLQHKHAAAK